MVTAETAVNTNYQYKSFPMAIWKAAAPLQSPEYLIIISSSSSSSYYYYSSSSPPPPPPPPPGPSRQSAHDTSPKAPQPGLLSLCEQIWEDSAQPQRREEEKDRRTRE